jgi:hypothetical protein
MTLMTRLWSRGFTLSLFVGITLACGIRQDEFDCENAYAHLQQCCGTSLTLSQVSCHYTAGGCDVGPTYPDLDIAVSDCIRSQSCDVIRVTGMCTNVSSLIAQSSDDPEAPIACPNGTEPVATAVDSGGAVAIDASGDDVTTMAADAGHGPDLFEGDAQSRGDEGDAESPEAAADAEATIATDAAGSGDAMGAQDSGVDAVAADAMPVP